MSFINNLPEGAEAATWGSITGTLSSQTDLQTALDAKQDALIKKNVTLSASSWSSDTYTISDSDITASNVVTLTYPVSTSASDYTALQDADIRATAQAAGSLTLQALGTVPTSDLTITLVIQW